MSITAYPKPVLIVFACWDEGTKVLKVINFGKIYVQYMYISFLYASYH